MMSRGCYAQGDANKLWLIPTEFSHALQRFQEHLTNAEANGKAPLPTVPKDIAG